LFYTNLGDCTREESVFPILDLVLLFVRQFHSDLLFLDYITRHKIDNAAIKRALNTIHLNQRRYKQYKLG